MRALPLSLVACLASCGMEQPMPDGGASAIDMAMAAPDLPGGGCAPACGGVTPHCNASKHCVACLADADCASGSYCQIVSDSVATCTPGCDGDDRCANGQKCCNMRCVDTATDVKNCGGCGMPCAAVHASASCAAGQCASGTCDPGWGDCNNDPKDGCEANLHADPNNCTQCGMTCAIANAYVGCADGCYATACKFGFDDCNMNAMDGCEASVLADKNNCGGCGKACNGLPNATSSCVSGTCQIGTCNLGFADCDGQAANGCEVNTGTDVNNCGGCKNTCAQGNVCVQGGCTCPMCNIPGASAKCINNMCVFDHCNPGFADCNNNTADGCEVHTDSDAANCGGCNMVCPQNMMVCVNSMCTNLPQTPFFNSMPGNSSGSTQRGAGGACGTYLQANQSHQLVMMGANMTVAQPTNCKFIIWSHPAHMPLFATPPKLFQPANMTWFKSDPFQAFTLQQGMAYDIAADCDNTVTYYYDQQVDNVNGIQSFSQNPNWSNYAAPVFGGHAGVDCGIQLY